MRDGRQATNLYVADNQLQLLSKFFYTAPLNNAEVSFFQIQK